MNRGITTDSATQAIVATFLQRVIADRAAGRDVRLADYQSAFPGFEDAIAAEFERLSSGHLVPADQAGAVVVEPLRGAAAERYRDEGEIARGGMGTIHRVFDPSLRRVVAKKVLACSAGPAGGSLLRFLEEAQVTAQLDHPGIVPVHELGVDGNGRYYFTMSLVRGEDLRQVIERVHRGDPAWTLPRALGVVQRVCDAVSFAHEHGVIHRDLKPANVMVGRFGETYVMDWGLASVRDDAREVAGLAADVSAAIRSARRDLAGGDTQSPFVTHEGDVIGTPAYMAPEQAAGSSAAIGPHSDVYAIGAILYHLIAGRMPYADDGSTTWQDVLAASRAGPPRSLPTVAPGASPELVSICEKAMARDPGDRYPTCKELGHDLAAYLEGRVVRAHASGAIVELRKWIHRNRLAAVALACAFVSLAAGLAISLHLGRRTEEQARVAEMAYLGALDAVETMFNRVVESELKHIPGTDHLRRGLMTDAATLLERFVAEHSGRESARFRLGKTYGQLAGIYGALGDTAKSAASWSRAEAVFAQLAVETPNSPDVHEKLAGSRRQLAAEADRAGRPDDAVRILTESAVALDRLLSTHGDHLYLAYRRAGCEEGLAEVHHHRGRLDQAHVHTSRGLERLTALLEHPACDSNVRMSFVNSALNQAITLGDRGDRDAADAVLQRARAVLEREIAGRANAREALHQLARCWSVGGQMAHKRQDVVAAEHAYEQALAVLRRLTREFPLDPANWFVLGVVLHNRALLVQEDGDLAGALAMTEEAIAAQRRALAGAPGHRGYLRQCYGHLTNRLLVLRLLERHGDLAAGADALRELDPENAEAWRSAGWFLWVAAGLAGQDEALAPAERVRRRDDCMARGERLIREAFRRAGGAIQWFDDARLADVRDHPVFTAVLADLRARAVDGKVPPERN